MGTSNNTTGNNSSSLNFNPNSQNLYNMLTGQGGGVLGQYINNPLGNSAYTMGAANSQAGAQQAGANNMAALNQNAVTNGLTGQAGAGFMSAQKAQTGRANQAMTSQGNVQNVMQALQRQMSAAGTGLSYTPQLTGQSGNFNQTSSMGGLGTWLPQLLGMAGGAGMAALTGGASKMAQGAMSMPGASQPSYMPGGGNPQAPSMSGMAGINPSMLSGLFGGGSSSSAPSPLFGMMPQAQ